MTRQTDALIERARQMESLAASGLTVYEIAEAVGVCRAVVYRWSYGAANKPARPGANAASERAEKMAGMYRQGLSLAKIGQHFKITRERVRQVLAKQGIKAKDGGAHVSALLKESRRTRDADARAQLAFGVSHAELAQLRKDRVVEAFKRQSYAASNRGIAWRLTFAEWFAVWQTSGKLHLRGRGKGKYVMSRIRDDGCYEMGNVHIQLATENSRDAVEVWRGKAVKANRGVFLLYPGTKKPWFAKYGRKALGTHATEEEAVAVRAAYMQTLGVHDGSGLGRGRGYTVLKSGRFYMQAPNRKSTHKTAEEARAAYLQAIADLKAERASAQGA